MNTTRLRDVPAIGPGARPMPDWLHTSLANGSEPAPVILAWRIGMAIVLGGAVARPLPMGRRGEVVRTTFLTTLVLLAAVIAMATQVIGDNVARAFSLVGALSVVRFRTVVKDTQDTAFVIFAVVVGMASGANHLMAGVVGLLLILAASPALWPRPHPGGWHGWNARLSVRIALSGTVRPAVEQVLAAATRRSSLTSLGTARQGASLELTYRILLRPGSEPGRPGRGAQRHRRRRERRPGTRRLIRRRHLPGFSPCPPERARRGQSRRRRSRTPRASGAAGADGGPCCGATTSRVGGRWRSSCGRARRRWWISCRRARRRWRISA